MGGDDRPQEFKDQASVFEYPVTVSAKALTVTFYSDYNKTTELHFIDPTATRPPIITLGLPAPTTSQWAALGNDGFFLWTSGLNAVGGSINQVHFATISGNTSDPSSWSDLPATPQTVAPGISTTTDGSATSSSASATASTKNSPSTLPSPTGPESTSNASAIVTATSTPSKVPIASHKGLSNGAVAGVAIGCLLVGALLAGFLVWFCLGRYKRKQHARDHEGSALAFLPREKTAAVVKAQSVESGSPISKVLDNALPQPSEDKAISGEIAKLESSVKNHVQSYYHNRSISPGLLDLDDLHALGNNLPISTGTLSTLLGHPETRDIALRFVIAWVMISRMELYSDPDTTFLPPEIARCFQTVSNSDGTSRAHALFLANWRRITAELLQSTYSQNSFSSSDSRSYSIGAALSVLDAILQPYADSRMDNNQRVRNLEEILKRAASFAFTLFAHPSSWTFDWKEEQGVKSGSLCIFPALLQVSDDTGEAVKPPRQFSDAVVRTLDG
ncbi:hypothetical protein BDV96DRAFT_330258 [Lophiotrema nucula]|uniref:Uncharacterized protein n=1 Tax=Lophiotrema nucula TaxID=690887 RepID=A0A6A5YK76_9PLEO|nr:hypothetical protein BDV96DRAFT_330258 [Lophiotrema nucula]